MRAKVEVRSLAPSGLLVESLAEEDNVLVVTPRAAGRTVACQVCGTGARRVHSRYVRTVADLPCTGRPVRLRLEARRLHCEAPHCRRRIFAERFGGELVAARAANGAAGHGGSPPRAGARRTAR